MNTVNFDTINTVFDNKSFISLFGNLWCRWEDEKDYEDINDYGKVLVKKVNELTNMDFTNNIKMTKRPFGFKLATKYQYKSGKIYDTDVVFKISSSGQMSWTTKAKM